MCELECLAAAGFSSRSVLAADGGIPVPSCPALSKKTLTAVAVTVERVARVVGLNLCPHVEVSLGKTLVAADGVGSNSHCHFGLESAFKCR